jgi:hypothetical protein
MIKGDGNLRRKRTADYMQRHEDSRRSARINTVGNSLDNLFILHRKSDILIVLDDSDDEIEMIID